MARPARAFAVWQVHADEPALEDTEIGEGDCLVAESTPAPLFCIKARSEEARAAREGTIEDVETSESHSSIHEWIERMGRRKHAKNETRVERTAELIKFHEKRTCLSRPTTLTVI